MSQILIFVLILALIAYLSYREYLSKQERGELMDRLMAKSLEEFKAMTAPPEPEEEPQPETIFDLDSPEAMKGLTND